MIAASLLTSMLPTLLKGLATKDDKVNTALKVVQDFVGTSEGAEQLTESINKQQSALNLADAQSNHPFRWGWRPAIGWVCVAALGWHYLLEPIAASIASLAGLDISNLPRVDFDDLWTLMGALLGMSGLRTFDKVRGNK